MELWQEIVELQKIGDCIKSEAKFMPIFSNNLSASG